MNSDERLKLKEMIKQNNVTDYTEKIRELKHSSLLKRDVETLLKLKETHKDNNEFLSQECSFLFMYYTDIFNKIKKDEINISILYKFLTVLKKIEDNEIDQHEGSYEVGLLLKSIYVDSALKKAEKLNNNETEYKKPQENISWKDWKYQNNSSI
jgi:hypothetical protein